MNEQYYIIWMLFFMANLGIMIINIAYVSSKMKEMKSIIEGSFDLTSDNTEEGEIIRSKNSSFPKYDEFYEEYKGLKGKLKKFLALDDDDDLFGELDDEEEQEKILKFREKKQTEEIIDLIDLYEVKLNLNHRLCEDIKAGKFETLTQEKLMRLNKKYNSITSDIILNPQTNSSQQITTSNYPKTRKMFITGQEMVDYVAKYGRLVYDDKLKTTNRIYSFDTDIYGNLLIYYDKNDMPFIFKPYRFGSPTYLPSVI